MPHITSASPGCRLEPQTTLGPLARLAVRKVPGRHRQAHPLDIPKPQSGPEAGPRCLEKVAAAQQLPCSPGGRRQDFRHPLPGRAMLIA